MKFNKFITFSHQLEVNFRWNSVGDRIRSPQPRSEPDLYLNWQEYTHQQVVRLNTICEVQKSTCYRHAARGQQTSTRGQDFILQQIVFRAASHWWKGLGYTFIPCGYPNSSCSMQILNIIFNFIEISIIFFTIFHENNHIFSTRRG